MRLALLAALLPRLALATTYEVGPGKPYGSVGAVPWESLAAGDTVLIHARPTPYAEKWVVNARGTESAPITMTMVARRRHGSARAGSRTSRAHR